MKIVYLAPCRTKFPSRDASSIHMIRMCEALSELGHDVTMMATFQGVTQDSILTHYGVDKAFNIKLVKVPSSKLGNVIYAWRAGREAVRQSADLVLGRSPSGCCLSSYFGIDTVFDSHGPVWGDNPFDRVLYCLMIKNRHLVRMTVNSKALKLMYEERGYAPNIGVTLAHNGSKEISARDLEPVDNWPGRPAALQLGYIGHLYPGRGVEVIVGCAKAMPECDFHIIGGTENDIVGWKEKAVLSNLHFHGFVKNSLVPRYRNMCDVLLAPYQGSGVAVAGGEGDSSLYMNPIKIIEYMSSGKGIVCSDLAILREVLGDDTAIFAAPAAVSSWCDAISEMKSVSIRNRLGKKAQQKFISSLTWKARASIMLGS